MTRVYIHDLHTSLSQAIVTSLLASASDSCPVTIVGSVRAASQTKAASHLLSSHTTSPRSVLVLSSSSLSSSSPLSPTSPYATLLQSCDILIYPLSDSRTSQTTILTVLDTLQAPVFEPPTPEIDIETDTDPLEVQVEDDAQKATNNTDDASSEGRTRPPVHQTLLVLSTLDPWGEDSPRLDPLLYKGRTPTTAAGRAIKRLEAQVLAATSSTVSTHVMAAGHVLGGDAPSVLDPLWRHAWRFPTSPLPVVATSAHVCVPLTQLSALVDLVVSPILTAATAAAAHDTETLTVPQDVWPSRYLLVTEGTCCPSIRAISLAISRAFGTGSIHLLKDASDVLKWHVAEPGWAALSAVTGTLVPLSSDDTPRDDFTEDMGTIAAEYVTAHHLHPLRLLVTGPPGLQTGTLTTALAAKWDLVHLSLLTCWEYIQSGLPETDPTDTTSLNSLLALSSHTTAAQRASLSQLVSTYKNVQEMSSKDQCRLLRTFLASPVATHQGYVLSTQGLHEMTVETLSTLLETETLISDLEDEVSSSGPSGEEVEAADVELSEQARAQARLDATRRANYQRVRGPTHGVLLTASDVWCHAQAAAHETLTSPEKLTAASVQLEMALETYRSATDPAASTPTLGSYLEDTLTIKVLELEVLAGDTEAGENSVLSSDTLTTTTTTSLSTTRTPPPKAPVEIDAITRFVHSGLSRYNYHPTPAEARDAALAQRLAVASAQAAADAQHTALAAQELAAQETADLQAAARASALTSDETQRLQARALPLRHYLMTTVIPALTEGMLAISVTKPEDPIDFLADFLFRKGTELEDEGEKATDEDHATTTTSRVEA